jgi:coenzyme F420 hydrogenase subunit beta
MAIKTLGEIVDWRMCLGCGACAYAAPDGRVKLYDFFSEGIRPVADSTDWQTEDFLKICPALHQEPLPDESVPDAQPDAQGSKYRIAWGRVLDIWEGHATDEEIRFKGSSGGVLTALSAYCVEKGGFHGVLHTGSAPEDPTRNRTRLSTSRAELLAAAGSRYAPASVCDGLDLVENAPEKCVVIGKPVDITGVRNAQKLRPALAEKVGLTLSFFCAESPSTHGTWDLLKKLGEEPSKIARLRYRGFGWPGHFTTAPDVVKNEPAEPYQKAWRFLQSYRAWSTHLWPDGTGELADITCGDPWYEKPDGNNQGFSLIVVRTLRGREILKGAIEAGYLELSRAEAWKLEKSQGYLLQKKAAVWGRVFTMRLFGLPIPKLPQRDLFDCWLRLSNGDKARSIVGTAKRILRKKLTKPLKLDKSTAVPVNVLRG